MSNYQKPVAMASKPLAMSMYMCEGVELRHKHIYTLTCVAQLANSVILAERKIRVTVHYVWTSNNLLKASHNPNPSQLTWFWQAGRKQPQVDHTQPALQFWLNKLRPFQHATIKYWQRWSPGYISHTMCCKPGLSFRLLLPFCLKQLQVLIRIHKTMFWIFCLMQNWIPRSIPAS